MALKIDIFAMELAAGSPNWLKVRHGPNIHAIRAKHRARHLKNLKKRNKFRAALGLLRRR